MTCGARLLRKAWPIGSAESQWSASGMSSCAHTAWLIVRMHHDDARLLDRLLRNGPALYGGRFFLYLRARLLPVFVRRALGVAGLLPQVIGARANLFLLSGVFLFHLITSG